MIDTDTIASISTPLGSGGISIIRVSGDRSKEIVNKIFKSKYNKSLFNMPTYTIMYGHIFEASSHEAIDEVILTYMGKPNSYTREDVLEISCHGGYVSTYKILGEVVKAGARHAEPGEFTKRAFLNGRIDLSQAEAVMDIINAKTELSLKSAIMQSQGALSGEISALRNTLLSLIAAIEVTVDFPEDDIEEITSMEVQNKLFDIVAKLDELILKSKSGKILKDGIAVSIVGKPNVGKSSLLNTLLMEQRAIVTDIPGTTRDIIEEFINIDGVPIRIIDTAGIRSSSDTVEKIGIEKSFEKIEMSDLLLVMLDSTEPLAEEDKTLLKHTGNKKALYLINKIDVEENDMIKDYILKNVENIKEENIVMVSVQKQIGIDTIKSKIKSMFFSGEIESKNIIMANERQKNAITVSRSKCMEAIEALKSVESIDLASIDIREAWRVLGEITGETLDENIIDKIFSEFCLGK